MLSKYAAAVAAFLLATGAASIAQTAPATTNVVKVDAKTLTTSGDAISGECWTSSIASTRTNAFRCMAGNSISDPCFTMSASKVVCVTDVFSNTGVVMKLTKPLPAAASPAPPQAWAMMLQSGQKCNRGTGTVVADYPFYCTGESFVCQEPDISKPQPAYFVKCATAIDGMHVKNVGSYLAKTIYE